MTGREWRKPANSDMRVMTHVTSGAVGANPTRALTGARVAAGKAAGSNSALGT